MGNQSEHSQQKVGSATLLPVGSAHNISLGVGCSIVHAVDAAEGEEVQEGEESLYVHPTISHLAVAGCACSWCSSRWRSPVWWGIPLCSPHNISPSCGSMCMQLMQQYVKKSRTVRNPCRLSRLSLCSTLCQDQLGLNSSRSRAVAYFSLHF